MNLRELLLQWRDLLDERETQTQFKDYQGRRWLSEGQLDLVLRRPEAFSDLLTEGTGNTSNGVADYAFPADFLALKTVLLGGVPCRRIEVQDAPKTQWGPTTADPDVAIVDAEQFRLFPTPLATVAYAAFYWARPGDLFQQVATFEPEEAWTATDFTKVTTNLSGNTTKDSEEENTVNGLKVTAVDADTQVSSWTPGAALNLGAETDSYVEIFLHCTATTNLTSVIVEFHTTDTTAYRSYTWTKAGAPLATGGQYLRALKSDFTTVGAALWTSLAKVYIKVVTSGNASGDSVVVDDLRIYRSPKIDAAFHPLLCTFAAAKALQSDEGMRDERQGENLMVEYVARANAMLGIGGKGA